MLKGAVCLFCRHVVKHVYIEFFPSGMRKNAHDEPEEFLEFVRLLGFDMSHYGDFRQFTKRFSDGQYTDIIARRIQSPDASLCGKCAPRV